MMTEEDIAQVLWGHSDIAQVLWDRLDIDLVWQNPADCNRSGRRQMVEPANPEEDNSCPFAGHFVEEDMRFDDPLLPSSC
jgi:hypothetical protein